MCIADLTRIADFYHTWSWGNTNRVLLFIDLKSSLNIEMKILIEQRTKICLQNPETGASAWFPKKGFQGFQLQHGSDISRCYRICPWFAKSIPHRKKDLIYASARLSKPHLIPIMEA